MDEAPADSLDSLALPVLDLRWFVFQLVGLTPPLSSLLRGNVGSPYLLLPRPYSVACCEQCSLRYPLTSSGPIIWMSSHIGQSCWRALFSSVHVNYLFAFSCFLCYIAATSMRMLACAYIFIYLQQVDSHLHCLATLSVSILSMCRERVNNEYMPSHSTCVLPWINWSL